jgi:hypothetical protein
MNDFSNPYASPQAAEPPPESPPTFMRPLAAEYRSARGRANFAMFAAGACVLCELLVIGSLAMQIQMLQTARTVGIDEATGAANDTRHMVVALVSVFAALASLIVLLVWIYRAYANLPGLLAAEIQFTPGWAVGWFFVPIMNLFRPYQAVRDIWNGSDPNRFTLSGQVLGEPASGAIVGWWWGLRIGSAVLGRVIDSWSNTAQSIEDFMGLSMVLIAFGAFCNIPLHITQLLLVRQAQRHQEERYELVEKYRSYPLPGGPGTNPFAEPA